MSAEDYIPFEDFHELAWARSRRMRPELEPKLIKAAKEEQQLVDALISEGVLDADRTTGDKMRNRKLGDVQFTVGGKLCSLELQCAEPGRSNYSFSRSKRSKFVGHGEDGKNCFHMFGNDTVNKFMVLAKGDLDEIIDEADESNTDLYFKVADSYIVLKPSGLAASGKVLGYGNSIEECVADFIKNLRAGFTTLVSV